MNAYMNIQVRVLSAQALAQLRALEMQSRKTAMGVGAVGRQAAWGLPFLSKWGNQVQWAGRQLMYNFTMPIALAIGMSTKFALENEKAMVRVQKVYGDNSKVFNRLAKTEIPALAQAFEALSNKFGVAQSEVINIGADWAAAGASGIALAKSVDLTLQTMILGEIKAGEATQNLIAIQAQFGLSTQGLTKTIEILNMVENQTGASMKGLMDGLARAAGVARTAGVDVEHLAAMMAALTPATGSATSAGNGLKTIISRLLAPTEASVAVMKEMGIEVDRLGWQGMTATERLEYMAKSFNGLSKAQQALVSSVVASRYQVNRFVTLMRDVENENGYYQKSLRGTSDEHALFTQRMKELNRVLTSNPQMLKQTWVILQNAMTKAIIPLLPYIVYLAQQIAHLFQSFANLPLGIQKATLAGLIFLALVGPIARYVGAVTNLIGLLSAGFHFLAKATGISAIYNLLFMKSVVAADGTIVRQRRSLLGLGRAMLLLPFRAAIAGFGLLNAAVLLVFGGMSRILAASSALIMRYITVLTAAVFAEFLAVQRYAAGLTTVVPRTLMIFASLFVGIGRIMTLMAGAVALGVAGVGQAIVFLGPIFSSAYVSVLAATRTFIGAFAVAWRTLPLIFGAVQVGLVVAFARIRVLFATLPVISGAAVAATGVVWRTLPLIFGAVQAGLIVAFARIRAVFALLPAMSAATVAVVGAIWRTLPLILGAVSLGVQLMVIRIGLIMRTMAVYAALAMQMTGMAIKIGFLAIWRALPALVMRFGPMLAVGVMGAMNQVITVLLRFMPILLRVLTGPWGLAITAILGIAYAFRDKIADAWGSILDAFRNAAKSMPGFFAPIATFFRELGKKIMDAFWALPEGVRNAMIAVLTVVRDAALQVYEWMSYLNPFAHHSPSLVENVTKGMDVIGEQYGRAKGFGGPMKALHAQLEAAIKRQEKVVDSWKHKLDRANYALRDQQWILDDLKGKLDEVQQAYDSHKSKLEGYASAPIQGMQRFSNKIFENEMAQKKLRLEMLKWEQQAGGGVDDLKNKLATLYGEIEMLTGQAASLRSAGAGSDVLAPINAQIAAMEAQAKTLTTTINNNPVDKLQQQMDDMQRQGEILQLQYDIKYDPLTRQIEQLANAQKELSYGEIVHGIKGQQAAMDALQPRLDRYTAAVDRQQAVVDRLTRTRDLIQRSYDRENDKLQHMKDRLSDVNSKMDEMNKKRGKLGAAVPNDVKTFRAGAGADWADPGTFRKIGRQGGLGDQSQMIKDFASKTNEDMAKIFGDFDMFAPLKKKWHQVWGWLKEHVGPVVRDVRDGIVSAFKSIPNPFGGAKNSGFMKGVRSVWDTITDIVRSAWKWIKKIIALFEPDFKRIFDTIIKAGKRIWNEIGPELAKFGKIIKRLPDAFQNLWKILKPVVAILAIAFVGSIKVAASLLGHVLGPVLDFIITTIKNLIKIIRGGIEIIVGVLSGDWKMAWQGVKDIVSAVFSQIGNILSSAWNIIKGIVQGIVGGIVGFFEWLWDVLVGHSIVPDIVNGIITIFKSLAFIAKWIWNNVLKPIYDFFKMLWKEYVKPALKAWWSGMKAAWNALTKIGKWFWEHILKPVWNWIKDLWKDYVKPALADWWNGIKNTWEVLKKLGGWLWDHVLKPVWNWVKNLWKDYVKPALATWWSGIKNAWADLKKLGSWVWDHVMKPVFDKIKEGWTKVRDWLTENKDFLMRPAKGVVNAVIDAVNFMIKGLNKISDILPGIDFHITTIEKFERGGALPQRRVGSGFVANGARAIVGEGRRGYPEFVIPTDPSHRKRALALHQMAGQRLGSGGKDTHGIKNSHQKAFGVPAYSIGGWIGDLGKGAWNKVKGLKKNAVNLAYKPFAAAAKGAINHAAPWAVARALGNYGVDQIGNWVGASNRDFEAAVKAAKKKYAVPKGGDVAVNDPSNPAAISAWHGGTFTNRFIAHMQKAEQLAGVAIHVMQGGFRPRTSYSGSSHAGDAVDLQVNNSLIRALRRVGIAAGDRTGLGDWAPHTHAVPGPDAGSAAGSAIWQWQDYLARGGMNQPLNSTWGLANGGIVKATRGGILARIGEGGRDEAVTPLPRDWKRDAFGGGSGGDTIININGNLEFPNITDDTDAERFIENLVILAKD